MKTGVEGLVKILVFGGWFGSGNLGDDAILIGLREIFQSTLGDAELVALSSNPGYTEGTCDVRAVQLRSPKEMFTSVGSRSPHLGAFRDADLCLVSGGTPIYDYDHVSRSINFGLPRILGKKLVCFGIGVKPISSVTGRRLITLLIRRASLISVRDRPSGALLESMGIGKQINVTGDSALFMRPDIENTEQIFADYEIDTSKPIIALCPRALSPLHRTHYHEELTQEKIDDIRRELARTADKLIDNGFELISIPMHRAHPDDDFEELNEIKKMMKNEGLKALECPLNPQEAMGILGLVDLVIGLRLHSLIFAASQGVPVASIGYDSKIRGFMELAGAADFVSDPKSGRGDLMRLVERALNEKKELGHALKKSTIEMRSRISTEARKVTDLVE